MESRSVSIDMLNFANGLGWAVRGNASGASDATRGCGTWACVDDAPTTRIANAAVRMARTRLALRRFEVAAGRIIAPGNAAPEGGVPVVTAVLGTRRAHSGDRVIVLVRTGEVNLSEERVAAGNDNATTRLPTRRSRGSSADVEQLVGLQAEPPLRMREAVRQRGLGVGARRLVVARVEWLEEELREVERRVARGITVGVRLRIDELELVAARQHERRTGLGTHAHMIESGGCGLRPVRLHGDLEPAGVQRADRWFIELQQGLAARADDERASARGATVRHLRPARQHGVGESVGGRELSAVRSDTDEIRVAELTDGARAIRLAACPQVAATEAT